MRKLIAGNWKMNGLLGSFETLEAIITGLEHSPELAGKQALICPPYTLLESFARRCRETPLAIGAQTCHELESGAHTGDISAKMVSDCGAAYVILGHSERRADHSESSLMISAKVRAAVSSGLVPIVCVGENLAQREDGQTRDFVLSQLRASLPDMIGGHEFVIAYEPIWAIGTGLTASTRQIGEVHSAIRGALHERFGAKGQQAPIIYGGSVKPENANDILSVQDVDGALIGGASLNADDFLSIYRSA